MPDAQGQLTSDHGWDTKKNKDYLVEMITPSKKNNIRTSIFVDANLEMVKGAKETGADRIELYTEEYARLFFTEKEKVIKPFFCCCKLAGELGLGVNAGHDLSLDNLKFFKQNVPNLLEVSIGHALISDALYLGLENTVQLYLRQLK